MFLKYAMCTWRKAVSELEHFLHIFSENPYPSAIMKTQLCVLVLLFCAGGFVTAQSVVVNPNGTHSVLINSGGGTSTLVNSNGTHSTVINHGPTSTVVNQDGTHSLLVNHGSISTLINQHASHATPFHAGLTSTESEGDQPTINSAEADSIRMNRIRIRMEKKQERKRIREIKRADRERLLTNRPVD